MNGPEQRDLGDVGVFLSVDQWAIVNSALDQARRRHRNVLEPILKEISQKIELAVSRPGLQKPAE